MKKTNSITTKNYLKIKRAKASNKYFTHFALTDERSLSKLSLKRTLRSLIDSISSLAKDEYNINNIIILVLNSNTQIVDQLTAHYIYISNRVTLMSEY